MTTPIARYSHIAVARNLRPGRSHSTMGAFTFTPSMNRTRRNRRKVDDTAKSGKLRVPMARYGHAVFKVVMTIVLSCAMAVAAWQGFCWARTSDAFALKRLTVVGNNKVTDGQLAKLAGLSTGVNLFSVDLTALERAMATHPWVKSVRIERHLPHDLVIDVTEQVPVALLALSDVYLVNAEGEPFKRVQAGETLDLPLLTGLERDALVNKRDETRSRIRRSLAAMNAYHRSPSAADHPVSEVNLSDTGFSLVTSRGEEIVFGEAEVEAALERLARVRKELAARQLEAEVIRLDNRTRPDWVAVRAFSSNGRKP
jgi:cell division protein FtsQ